MHNSSLVAHLKSIRSPREVNPLAKWPRATREELPSGEVHYHLDARYPTPFLRRACRVTTIAASATALGSGSVLAFTQPAFAPTTGQAFANIGLMTAAGGGVWFGLGHVYLFRRRLRIDVTDEGVVVHRWLRPPVVFTLPLIERFSHRVHEKIESNRPGVHPLYRETFHLEIIYDGMRHPLITILGKAKAIAICDRLNELVRKKMNDRDRRASGTTRTSPPTQRPPSPDRTPSDSTPDL